MNAISENHILVDIERIYNDIRNVTTLSLFVHCDSAFKGLLIPPWASKAA